MRAAAMLALAMVLTGPHPAAADEVRVLDGDTVVIAGRAHDLHAIDAPEPGTRCLIRGRQQDCGLIARAALLDLTAGAAIICRAPASGHGLRCLAGGYDLSEGMLHTGWAFAAEGAPARYRKVTAAARAKGRGLWASDLARTRR